MIKKSFKEKFKIRDSELFLAAIHSHSSPVVSLDINKLPESNIKYTHGLKQKLIDVVGRSGYQKPETGQYRCGSRLFTRWVKQT